MPCDDCRAIDKLCPACQRDQDEYDYWYGDYDYSTILLDGVNLAPELRRECVECGTTVSVTDGYENLDGTFTCYYCAIKIRED